MIRTKTIVAVATPPGVGALALLRLSGKNAFKIFSEIISEKEKFINAPVRFVKQYFILNTNTEEIIDEVTAIKYKNPFSFTGEDIVEIISHGGTFTVKNIYKQLLQHGAEIAEKGEFSKRAFLNGKIDLMKAEAIKALIESKSEDEFLSAINLYNGFYKKLSDWQEEIQQEISFCEAEIEFGEDDLIPVRTEKTVLDILKKIDDDLKKFKLFKEIKNGLNIVIGGPANAGKSTLFNYLVGYKRAIVHDQPGTTRDSINVKMEICGRDVNLFDTAGFRSTADSIENEGIQISKDLLSSAHLILWITDISENCSEEEINILNSINNKKTVIVLNKMDKELNESKMSLFKKKSNEIIQISIKEKLNLKKLMSLLEKTIVSIYTGNRAPDIFINERQEKIAKNISNNLEKAIKNWKHKEIASYYLRSSLKYIEEINGKVDNEKIINKIFTTFCIGK